MVAFACLAGTRARNGQGGTARACADDHHYRAADFDVAEAVQAVAEQRDLSPAALALAWLLGKPGVSATIVGITQQKYLSDALSALAITLSPAELKQLDLPYVPHSLDSFT